MVLRLFEEETLDPRDWSPFDELGERMLADMMEHIRTIRDRPVWNPVPSKVKARLREPIPEEPLGEGPTYDAFRQWIQPHMQGNLHPRFWGWVVGSGSVTGMLAELLTAGLNPNNPGFDQAGTYLEDLVLDWFKELLGFPAAASGILLSGGSMANLVGMAVARNAKGPYGLRHKGLAASAPLIFYASEQVHSSVLKAVELLGVGSENLRLITVNDRFEIDADALLQAIRLDRERGLQPVCIVGNAGAVNTGACDDLERLADICREENLWFHVDGAFGSLAALSPQHAHLVRGMERADSLAFDFHKWLHIPYEAACVLVRHSREHHDSFAVAPDYLSAEKGGILGAGTNFSEYGVQLSRRMRALKIWFTFRAHGIGIYRRLIDQNIAQAQYLAELVTAEPELELAAPAPLNIVCFRFVNDQLDREALNELNAKLLYRLQDSGVAMPSNTKLNGHFVIRVSITNHRTRREDLDLLVKEVKSLGRKILAEHYRPAEAVL